jgi:hypothetical protein
MFLFDAFSFIQVTLFFFIFVGLGSVLLRLPRSASTGASTSIAALAPMLRNPPAARGAQTTP